MTHPVLITGASRGLGAAFAEALSTRFHIIAVGRTVGALEELDDRIQAKGGSATLAPMDITQADAMAALCQGVLDRWGGLGLWLHCAVHAAPLAPVPMMDEKDWLKSLAGNVTATARLISYVAPLLGTDGRAVFFDDPHAGEKFYGAYGASKAAQMALVRSWQAETERTGPQVQVVQPRPMATALRARFHPGEDRAPLVKPADEAQRLLKEMHLD